MPQCSSAAKQARNRETRAVLPLRGKILNVASASSDRLRQNQKHIYLAQPPLYRLTQGARSIYAMNDEDREQKVGRAFKAGTKVEISRFKGLGEMPPAQLKETTMDPAKRTLLKVMAIPEMRAATNELVESLMGRRPELRFAFIQERAKTVEEVDV
jgi:topoisomerase-4 subunit B